LTATKARARPTPQRTCVACRTTTNKRGLIRIVRTANGIVADPTGKLDGRGAYVCGQSACWDEALGKGRLEHSLKAKLTAKDADALRAYATTHSGGDR
jgi:predicted RNA-binding protein YlxR (DUF448 family)